MNGNRSIATLLLAAGSSSRLGRPKQLLPFRGTTLLRHSAQTALNAQLGPVFVVLGCHEMECRRALKNLPVKLINNAEWLEGLGTSIAAGMRSIDETSCAAVLVMLCDQPQVTANDLQALVNALPGHAIVASDLSGTLGSPALFSASCFNALRALQGPQGAKALFHQCSTLATIPCPHAALDVDTEQDVARLS